MSMSPHADDAAASFEYDRVAPDAVMPRDPFAPAHLAETILEVQGYTRVIFGEYARLQRPDALSFRGLDQRAHQRAADAEAARRGRDVDADLGHAGVDFAPRHRTQRGPAENPVTASGRQPALRQVAGVPTLPVRRF